jgi:CheY-like chemotaxis protein
LRVLLVEGRPLLAEAIVALLNTLSAQGVVVPNGEEACSRLLAGEECDVVLCDVELARVDGFRLLFWTRIVRPELVGRIVFMTTEPHLPAARIVSATYVVLSLPFTREALAGSLEETVRQPRWKMRCG